MPEVPGQPYEPYGTVTPQVEQLRPIGVQFLPDAYGAATAKAMQNFGIAGVDAAQKVFERAQALKQVDIENKTRDQLTQTMGGFEDDRAKFMASEGLSATGANLTGFQAKLDAAYQDGLTKARAIGGDFAANKFGNEAASWYRQVSNAATEHSATQLKSTTKNSLRAQQALLLEELRRNPDDAPDPTTGRTIRDRLTDSEDQAGRLLGSSPEQIELDKNNILSAAAHTQIEGLKLRGDIDGATKLYEKYRDDGTLTTEAANKALKTVQAGVAGGVSLSTFGGFKTGQTMSLGAEAVAPERAKDAIARTEGTWLSSGRYNYQALGPVVQSGAHKGYQALGKYQVMEDLLPDFLQQAGMPPMTRQQFLNNPQAQEQLFDNVFIKKYMTKDANLGTDGSFNDAASMWFHGTPLNKADPKYNDGHFNTPQYVQDANRNLYKTMTEADAMRIGEQAGGRFTSIDPDAPIKVSDKVGDLFRQDVQRRRVDAFYARQGLGDFLDTEEGAQVRNLQDLQNSPTGAQYYEQGKNAEMSDQQFQSIIKKHVDNDNNDSPAREANFNRLRGMLSDDGQRMSAAHMDPYTVDLRADERKVIQGMQRLALQGQPPPITRQVNDTMKILDPVLILNGIDRQMPDPKTQDKYWDFRGRVYNRLKQMLDNDEVPPGDPEKLREMFLPIIKDVSLSKDLRASTPSPTAPPTTVAFTGRTATMPGKPTLRERTDGTWVP